MPAQQVPDTDRRLKPAEAWHSRPKIPLQFPNPKFPPSCPFAGRASVQGCDALRTPAKRVPPSREQRLKAGAWRGVGGLLRFWGGLEALKNHFRHFLSSSSILT